MNVKQITRIAFMAAIMACVFQAFANVLYLELITFTIVIFACAFPRRDTVLACVIFALINMVFMGINPWTLLYLVIYPTYAWSVSTCSKWLMWHPLCLAFMCGFLSFLTGQLLDLPYLLFSGKVTVLYLLMGLRTSIMQGVLSFLCCLLLFEPLMKRIRQIVKSDQA